MADAGVLYIGIYARVLRSAMIEAQEQDYVRTAHAKGLTERRVLVAPLAQDVADRLLLALRPRLRRPRRRSRAARPRSSSACTASGKLTYDSLQNFDLPVIMACVMYAAFFVVVANAMVDLLYAWLDPRVRIA